MDKLNIIQARIDALLAEKTFVLIAIDGTAASGKSTLAQQLQAHYDCNLFHMDDFFLRPEQRTAERFAEVGGNVDYERFHAEVLQPLMTRQPFAYRPFDCSTFELSEPVCVQPKQLNLIEGSYCLHNYFGDPYDLKILLTIEEQEQRDRILRRPAFLHDRFFGEWIPMEQRYAEGFGIRNKADLIL